MAKGVQEAEIKAALAKSGYTEETIKSVIAEKSSNKEKSEAIAKNNGLKGSFKSLASTIGISTTALGLLTTGLTALIAIGISAWQNYKQSIEDAVSSASEAASTYSEQTSSIDEMVSKYQDLREQLIAAKGNEEETYNIKQQLLDLQTELNEKFGDEYGKLNLVTDAYKDQTEAIKAYNKEASQKYLNENRKGIEEATNQMEKDNIYYLGSMNGMVDASELKYLDEIKSIASDNNIEFTDNGFEFVGNAEDASDSINAFMNQIKDLQKDAGDTSSVLSGIFDGILDNSADALADADSIIEEYDEIYEQAKLAEIASDDKLSSGYSDLINAVSEYNDAVSNSEDPYNDENVQKAYDNLQTIKQGIDENSAEWGKYSNIVEEAYNQADTSAYSFYGSIKDNIDGVGDLTNELKGLSNVDLQAMADDGDNGDAFDKLCTKAEEYGLEVQDVIDLLVELGYVQGELSNQPSVINFDSSQFLESVSAIQSGYEKLLSAQDEFNEYGAITASTLKDLVDNNLIQYLQYTSDGLSINTQALENNEQALKDTATAELYNAMCNDIQNLSLGDTASLSDIAQTAIANLDSAATTAGQNAAIASQGWWEYGASIESIPGVSKLTGDNYNKAQAIVNQYKNIANSINSISVGKTSASKSSSKKSAEKTMEDIQKEWKEYLDKYLAMYKAELDAGLIDFNTFLNKSRSLLDEYYRDGKISAKDYWDFVKSLYEDQLSVYDKVLSAVTRRYDKEIEKINDIIDGIEEQNETLEKQLDEYDSILSVVDSVYEAEIDRIKEQQDAIDDTISKLKEENDEHQRAINLEKARWQLYESLNNRKVKLFNGKEFVYTTNRDEVREAQQNLADLEFDQTIDSLEKEKEALDAEIEKLEEFKSKWAEITNAYDEEINRQLAIALWGKDYEKIILSNRLSDIESFKNNYVSIQHQINSNEELIKSYNEKKSYYEDLKKQWSDISSEYKNAQEDLMAQQVLGANWEKDILSGRIDVLNNFKDKYIAIQKEIANAAAESAKAQAEASSAPSTSSTTSSGGGGSTTTTTATEKQYHVVHLVGKGHKTQSEAQSNIVTNSGNGVYKYTDGMWYVYRNEKYTDKTFSTTSAADEYIKKQLTSGKYGILKYASGGIVKKDNGILSSIAKSFGEDTIIAAKDGERVLTPTQNEMWEKWTNALPNLQNLSNMINVNMPDYSDLNNIVVKDREIQPSFSIGEIHLHEVNDVDNFAKAIIRELPSKVTQRLGK